MLKLGVLVDEAPKAGYEVELALAYFKNLSVTKRYQIPLQLKLPKDAPVCILQPVNKQTKEGKLMLIVLN